MKKALSFVIAALLCLTMLAGCGGESSSSSSSSSSSTDSSSESSSESSSVDSSEPEDSSSDESSSDSSQAQVEDRLEAIKAAGKIVMLTNAAFPPFEYVADNVVAGVDADIAAEIAKDLGVELEITDMDFDGIITALQNGRGDFAAAGMTIKPDRLEQVDFSIEYVKSSQYVIIKKGSGVTVDTLADCVIGVQEGTTGDFYATDDIMGDPNTENVKRYKNAIIASQDLMNGRVDAVIIDKLPAESIVAQNADTLELLPDMLTEESYAIAVQKGQTALLDAINATLQRLVDEGKVDEYVIKHMGE